MQGQTPFIALGTRTPGGRGVEAEARDLERQLVLGILLDEVRDLVAGEVRDHEVGLGLPHLQDEGAEVGGVGRHQLVGDELAAVLLHEAVGDAEEIVAEGIVGGQAEPLLALDLAVAEQGLAAGLDVHRVGGLDVEHVAVAAGAAQRVRVAARVDEQPLVAPRHLGDREARGRADLADDAGAPDRARSCAAPWSRRSAG